MFLKTFEDLHEAILSIGLLFKFQQHGDFSLNMVHNKLLNLVYLLPGLFYDQEDAGEMSVEFERFTQRNVPEERTVRCLPCEITKSDIC
jgi:hypothetical protein